MKKPTTPGKNDYLQNQTFSQISETENFVAIESCRFHFGCRSVNDSQKELGHLGYIPAVKKPKKIPLCCNSLSRQSSVLSVVQSYFFWIFFWNFGKKCADTARKMSFYGRYLKKNLKEAPPHRLWQHGIGHGILYGIPCGIWYGIDLRGIEVLTSEKPKIWKIQKHQYVICTCYDKSLFFTKTMT